MLRLITFSAVLLFVYSSSQAKNPASKQPALKIITVVVDSSGTAYIGKEEFTPEKLTTELHQRLWRSYLSTGNMYDAIRLEFTGEVLSDTRQTAIGAIYKAQQNTLKDLCVQKHKKLFEALSDRQKEKIERQFPVLFQKDFN